MDEISSTEFRRRYSSLTEPTIVRVGGHVLGLWTPRPPMSELYEVDAARLDLAETIVSGHSFNSRPFTPVPKKGK